MQRYLGAAVAFALLALSPVSGRGQTALRNRISRSVDASDRVQLHGSVHPLLKIAIDQGKTDSHRLLYGASLVFRLSSEQQAELDGLLRDQQDPSSLLYHKWLTPDEYGRRFGLSDGDLANVTSWLQSQGLLVESVSSSRTEVFFTGDVGLVEKAFATRIDDYTFRGEQHFANRDPISVPSALAPELLGVRGLTNFPPRSRLTPAPHFTSNISGNHFLIPGDFATIYNLDPLYSQGLDGSGQKIAVVGQTAINLADIRAFRSASGLAQNDPTVQLVPGTGTSAKCAGDLDEANLDVEWSGGVAKNASIVYVYSGLGTGTTCSNRTKNVFDALFYAINHTPLIAPVISISYGNCEKNIGSSTANIFRQWVQQANTQGQTVVAASGDDGAADCDFNDASATQGLAVDVPASIPEVTGVGGTEFSGDPAAVVPAGSNCAPATNFWGSSCSTTSGASALSYIPEVVWNDGVVGGNFSASGGGASAAGFFAKPSWQTGPGVPSDGRRDVPDIAFNASPAHDPYLICSQGSCVNGFRDASNNLSAVGGTSAGAPAFAGVLAIINQATQSSGQGNANQTLYSLAVSTPSAFHDIQTGNNKVPCTAGTTNCPSGGTIGFSAGANYDQTTGLGTLDVFNLVTAWPGFVASPAFHVSATPAAFTIASVGQSGTSSVSVTGSGGFVGTVALACSVPSNATTKISCSVSPASVALDTTATSQSATLTVSALAASGALRRESLELLATITLFPGLCLLVAPDRKRRSRLGAILIVLLAGAALSCGGGSSSSANQNQSASATYAVTVTGTSGSTTRSFTVNVTVK